MSNESIILNITKNLELFSDEFAKEFLARLKDKTPRLSGDMADGWDMTRNTDSIDIGNTQDYAGFVEYGTVNMEPRAPLRRTLLEKEDIAQVAKKKAGL